MHAYENGFSVKPTEMKDEMKDTPMTPSTDLYQVDHGWVLEVDLPGVAQKDVDLKVEDGVLDVEAKVTVGREGRRFHQEFNPVRYARRFPLGDQLDPERITADFAHGVLRIDLPMAESVKPRKIDVRTNA